METVPETVPKRVVKLLLGETEISIAETGTNFLEYGRLAQLLGHVEYVNNVCVLLPSF